MLSFEARDVTKHFDGVIALRKAHLKIDGTQVCGLVGANGSGKSTFAKICAGLIKADLAEFFIDNKAVRIKNPLDAGIHHIGLVHQNLSLIPDLSVWENIVLSREKTKGGIFLNNTHDKEEAARILFTLVTSGLSLEAKVNKLTPAQKQLVEIAKALYRKPRLLILDEPTAALEYHQVDLLFKKIKELKQSGISIIFISHRLWEITQICDIVYAFRNGQTVGTLDFSKSPREERLIFPLVLGDEEIVVKTSDVSKKNLQRETAAIEVENISLKQKVNGVSFRAFPGEILGIGGLSGHGQQELIMYLAGTVCPTSGTLRLNGKRLKRRGADVAIKNGIYLVPGDRQRDGLFLLRDVLFNTTIPRFPLCKDGLIPDQKLLAKIADKIISKAAIHPPIRKMLVKNLSGGNQQKVVFGKWLQFDPVVLLLNDPAKGVDIGAMNYFYGMVHEFAEKGATVILYASSNEELIRHCDRVLIMFEGQVVKELSQGEITDENIIKFSLRVEV